MKPLNINFFNSQEKEIRELWKVIGFDNLSPVARAAMQIGLDTLKQMNPSEALERVAVCEAVCKAKNKEKTSV